MFILRSKKPDAAEAAPPAGPLDRLGRRTSAETRAGSPGASVSKEARLASAAAALHDAVAPRLREMVRAGAPAGEITRQAGQLAQLHFRSNGVLLAPLEMARSEAAKPTGKLSRSKVDQARRVVQPL